MEQLHYTWSRRGREGLNRFQVHAVSERLWTPQMADVLAATRRVCRYDAPPHRRQGPQVSFGWFDHRGYRIAFSRVPVDLAQAQARKGNFAAHVLVAPLDELPAHQVVLRFGSAFWWRGVEADSRAKPGRNDPPPPPLRAVGLDEIEPAADGPAASADVVDALAAALFERPPGRRLTLVGNSHDIGRALRNVARVYPEALDGAPLSTYEGAPAVRFTITGALPGRRPEGSVHVLDDTKVEGLTAATLRALRAAEPGSPLRRPASGPGGPLAATKPREAHWAWARWLVAGAEGWDSPDADVDWLIRSPAATPVIVKHPVGRRRLAAALAGRDAKALDALVEVRPAPSADLLASLAADVADAYASTSDAGGCAGVAAVLDRCSPGVGADLLSRVRALAVQRPAVAAALQAADVTAVLALAAKEGASPSKLAPLVERAAAWPQEVTTVRTGLPAAYAGAVLLEALRAPSPRQRQLVAALSKRPDAVAAMPLERADITRIAALLRQSVPPAETRHLLQQMLMPLLEWGEVAAVEELLGRLTLSDAGDVIAGALRLAESSAAAELSALADTHAARLLRAGLREVHRPVHQYAELPLRLLRSSRSTDAAAARDALDWAVRYLRSSAAALRCREAVARITSAPLRAAVDAACIDAAVRDVRNGEDVHGVWLALDGDLNARLQSLLEAGVRNTRDTAAVVLLSGIATRLLVNQPQLLTRAGAFKDARLDATASALARRAGEARLVKYQKALPATAGKGVASWWHHLANAAMDQESRGRRGRRKERKEW